MLVCVANRGIGFEIARGLLSSSLPTAANLKVVITAQQLEQGEEAVKKLQDEFPDQKDLIAVEQLELTCSESIDRLKNSIKEKHQRLDILIHNAGIAFKDSDPTPLSDQAEPTLGINYKGTYALNDALWEIIEIG